MEIVTESLTILSQLEIVGSDFELDLPGYGGVFGKGVFAAVGQGMAIFFALIIVVWVGLGLYGGFTIISSFGDPQKIEKGWKIIKSIWIGITYLLVFFSMITVLAVYIGIGAPWDWPTNLQQCARGGPAPGRFYFQGKFVPDSTHPQGAVRKSYSELAEEYKTTNPAMTRVYVLCCDNGNDRYIGLSGVNAAIPECEVNSVEDL